jgi:hypothetical protein
MGMTEHEVRDILGNETIPIFTKEGEFGAIWCNGDFFPYYCDHIELWFGEDRKVINKTFTRAPVWNKVKGLFLPREKTSPKLFKIPIT